MDPESRTSGPSGGLQSSSPSVRGAVADARAHGRQLADEARHGANEIAEKRKRATVGYMQALSSAVGAGAEELKRQGQQTSASYAGAAADGLVRFAEHLSGRDPTMLIGELEDFARRRPALFFGMAVLAGAGLARFLKSSGDGDPEPARGESTHPYSAGPYSTGTGDAS